MEALLSEMICLYTVFLPQSLLISLFSSEADFAATGDYSWAEETFLRWLRKVKLSDGANKGEGEVKKRGGSKWRRQSEGGHAYFSISGVYLALHGTDSGT